MLSIFNLTSDVSIVIMISSKNIPRNLETRLFEDIFVGLVEARIILIFDASVIEIVTWKLKQ